MGIDESSVGTLESIYPDHKPLRSRIIFYDCWLREFTRVNFPNLLGAVDAILDCTDIASYLKMPEPRKKGTSKRACLIIEHQKAFTSINKCAAYLHTIYPHYTTGGIGTCIGRVLRNEQDTWNGLHFKEIDPKEVKKYE